MNEIARRYGRVFERGKNAGEPILCIPPDSALRDPAREKSNSDGQVIYDSENKALEAAICFEALGRDKQYVYPCERTKKNHYHLSEDKEFVAAMKQVRQGIKRKIRNR